jgi:hypothetical protein
VLTVRPTDCSAIRAHGAPDRLDPLELWRIADRVARNAEVRLAHAPAGSLPVASPADATAAAITLRRKANELLRVALGDGAGGTRELHERAEPSSA